MADGTPGTRLHGNPMYLGRLAGPFHVTLVMPVVGAARAALDEYETVITTRKTQSMPQMPRFEHFDFQRPFGHALTLTDAAEALMIKGCEMYAEYCARWADRRHADHDRGEHAAVGHDPARRPHGLRGGRAAVPQRGLGAGAQGPRLQRYFNDVAMYRGHSSAQQLNFASGLARLHFGLPWGMYGL